MEIVLLQRFNYAQIGAYKDYCDLSENQFLDEPFLDNSDIHYRIKDVIDKKYKNKLYFPIANFTRFLGKFSEKIYTRDDETIKHHFGRPFSEIVIHSIERKIIRNGDKVTIKIFNGYRYRRLNGKFFKKNYSSLSITFNIKTGNFTIIEKKDKTNESICRVNDFNKIHSNLYKFRLDEKGKNKFYDLVNQNNLFIEEYDNIMNNDIFFKEIFNVFGYTNELNQFTYSTDYNSKLYNLFLKYFVSKKQIKIPNIGWDHLIKNYYPTEKYLKKNDRKLVSSVLDMLNIKSKVTIKILHDIPNINMFGLYYICKLFGNDYPKYIGNINKRILQCSTTKNDIGETMFKYNILHTQVNQYELSNTEKDNLLKLLNSTDVTDDTYISPNKIGLLIDHFKMISELKKYNVDCFMGAKNNEEFKTEHEELSGLSTAIKKGWVVEYVYDEKTTNEIEKPIDSHYFLDESETEAAVETLYPFILKREEEYNEEGNFMHHCVATYANKETSIIVSLRTKSNQDRITCEFDIQTGNCVQARHFCNQNPPKMFEEGLLILKNKIKKNAKWGTLNWKFKRKVPIKINGMELAKEMIQPYTPF